MRLASAITWIWCGFLYVPETDSFKIWSICEAAFSFYLNLFKYIFGRELEGYSAKFKNEKNLSSTTFQLIAVSYMDIM